MAYRWMVAQTLFFSIVVSAGMGQVGVTPFPLLQESESNQRQLLTSYLERDNLQDFVLWKGVPIFFAGDVPRLAKKDWAFDLIHERIQRKLSAAGVADFEIVLVSALQDSGNPKTLEAIRSLFKDNPKLEFQVEWALIYGYGHATDPESVRRWYEGLEHKDPVVRRIAQDVVGKLFDNAMDNDSMVRYVAMWADGLLVRYGSTPTPEQLLTDPLFDAIRQRNPGRSLVTRAQLLELTKRREGERRSVKPKTADVGPKEF